MNDIAAIEARLRAALDRIAAGVDGLPDTDAASASVDEAARLREALDAERTKSEGLSERLRAMDDMQGQTVGRLEAMVARLQDQVAAQNAELERMRNVNAALRSASQSLREAVRSGAVDGGAINEALESELEATRAAQAADRAELDAILAELTPLIEEKVDG